MLLLSGAKHFPGHISKVLRICRPGSGQPGVSRILADVQVLQRVWDVGAGGGVIADRFAFFALSMGNRPAISELPARNSRVDSPADLSAMRKCYGGKVSV